MTCSSFPFFDGHNDVLLRIWLDGENSVSEFMTGTPSGHLDLPRMQKANMAGGLFAVFVPPISYVAKYKGISEQEAAKYCHPLRVTENQMVLLHALAHYSAGTMRVCRTVAEIDVCRANGVIALVMHIEGASALDENLSQLEGWYQQGLRSLGPFWNEPNRFGEGVKGAFGESPDTGVGLTPLGKSLVSKCNEYGILIDTSHMNERAFWDTAEISHAPLVATHSNAYSRCAQPRNLTDNQLIAIKNSDGIVGVNFGVAFLRKDGQRDPNTALDVLVEQISYLVQQVGEDCVGFGSDFDGALIPHALKDVTGVPTLIDCLYQTGFSHAQIEKMTWKNWRKILKMTW